MFQKPKSINLVGKKQYRIIPSSYPPINFFEDLVDSDEMETLLEIESLTNERLLQEVGDIFLVNPEDRVTGPGSTVVMAAFTHIGKSTRFSDGTYGVYYASLEFETAVAETAYHRERFLAATNQEPCEIIMRTYEGHIQMPFDNLCDDDYFSLHHHDKYFISQQFARERREQKSWGLFYNSVRYQGGKCIAAFRPKAISIPIQTVHLRYVWDGVKITEILSTQVVMQR